MDLVALLGLVNGLIVLLVVSILLHTLPERIRCLVELNAMRLDGSRSPRRASREAKDVRNFVANVLFGSVPLLVLTNGFIGFVHSFIIPVPLAAEAVSLIDPRPAQWAQRLEDRMVGESYARWRTEGGGTDEAARDWQRLLWNFWPLVVFAGVALAIVGFRVFARVYVTSLRELERNAHLRRKEYFWHDLAVMDARGTSPRGFHSSQTSH